MMELVLLAILIGGMVELIQYNGGIQYLMNVLTRNIRSKKGGIWYCWFSEYDEYVYSE